MTDYASDFRRSQSEARDLAALFGRDRVSRVAAGGFDSVKFYESRRAEGERYLAEIAAKGKRKRRKRKGKAA